MLSPLRKRAATSLDNLITAALRICWRFGPARFKSKLWDKLHRRWYKALNAAPAVDISLEELADYTPVRLNVTGDQLSVTWLRTGRVGATDPFFEDVIFRSWLSQVKPRLFRTGLDTLFELHKTSPGLAPTGFIFHTGRCGSTLVANILSVPANCLVLPEPFIVSLALILSQESLPMELRVNILRAVVSVLGRARTAGQRHLFLKFTSWNVLYLDFIKKVYPEIPWLFLYRHPLEVAVSNLKDEVAWTMAKSDPRLIQRHLGIPYTSELSAEEFYARAIAKYEEAALNGLNGNATLVHYRELSESFIPRLRSFFRIEATEEELQRMRECFQFYSKDGMKKRKHVADGQAKVSMASPYLKELVERHAVATYDALEQRQRATEPGFVRH